MSGLSPRNQGPGVLDSVSSTSTSPQKTWWAILTYFFIANMGVWRSLFSSTIFWAGKKGITNPDRFCLRKNELTKTVIRDMRKLIPGFFQDLGTILFKFRATHRHFTNCSVFSTQKNPSLLATNMNTKDWDPDQHLIYKCHLQNSGIRQALSSLVTPWKTADVQTAYWQHQHNVLLQPKPPRGIGSRKRNRNRAKGHHFRYKAKAVDTWNTLYSSKRQLSRWKNTGGQSPGKGSELNKEMNEDSTWGCVFKSQD